MTPNGAAGTPPRASDAARTILITGASSGIGRAAALQLADEGHRLVLLSRSAESLERTATECRQRGATTWQLVCDVGDRGAVEEAFDSARTLAGAVDGVIHSAAVISYGRFEAVPAEVFEAAIRTTLLGTANVARSALSTFGQDGGRGDLVVVGSLLGTIATPFMSSYVTAKWAVHGLVRTLQIEARDTPGIAISLISPGGVDTPVYRQAGTYLGVHGRPPPPVDSPERVARAVVEALAKPRRERSVGLANGLATFGFRFLPYVYDAAVTPLMWRLALADEPADPTPGNVLVPRPEREAVHDGWDNSVPLLKHGPDRRNRGGSRMDNDQVDDEQINAVTVERHTAAPAQAVWAVLSDGWSYAGWVVGASRVRDVDPSWPAPGARIHHSVGLWPALINDRTSVVSSVPDRAIVLKARAWPAGEARVEITVEPDASGCTVRITEDAVAGPGRLVPHAVRQGLIIPRNREALRRLEFLATGKAQGH
jgi:short-subunit dehydrogenase